MQIEFLPEEIWLRISLFTPVDELNVLINTCCALRDHLTTKAVWRYVIRDLLFVAPNTFIRRRLEDLSVAALRKYAHQLASADHRITTSDTSNIERIEMKIGTAGYLDVCLLPALPFLLWVSERGSIHITSVETGREVNEWTCPRPIRRASRAEIELWESGHHAFMFLVSMRIHENMEVDWETCWSHWLFSIDIDQESQLPKITLRKSGLGLTDHIDMMSAADDTVFATWKRQGAYHAGALKWRSGNVSDEVEYDDFTSWSLSSAYDRVPSHSPRHLHAMSSNTFLIFCAVYVVVFRLPDEKQSYVKRNGIPVLEPIWSYDFEPRLAPSYPTPLIQAQPYSFYDHGDMFIEFAMENVSVTLRIPPIGDNVQIAQIPTVKPPENLERNPTRIFHSLSSRLGSLSTEPAHADERSDRTWMDLIHRPLAEPHQQALAELRLGPRLTGHLTLPLEADMVAHDLDHDEWTGLAMVAGTTDGADSVTVWRLST